MFDFIGVFLLTATISLIVTVHVLDAWETRRQRRLDREAEAQAALRRRLDRIAMAGQKFQRAR